MHHHLIGVLTTVFLILLVMPKPFQLRLGECSCKCLFLFATSNDALVFFLLFLDDDKSNFSSASEPNIHEDNKFITKNF